MQRQRAHARRATKRCETTNVQNLTARQRFRVGPVLNLKRDLPLSVSFHSHATSGKDTQLLHLPLRNRLEHKGVTKALNARNHILNKLKRRLLKVRAVMQQPVLLRCVS